MLLQIEINLLDFEQKFRRYRVFTFIAYAALLSIFIIWNVTRASGISWVILLLQGLPLLALLPGLTSGYYRAYSWLCFVVLLYFIVAVTGAMRSNAGLLDYLFLSSTVALFISSMLCSRYAQRVQKNILSSNTE